MRRREFLKGSAAAGNGGSHRVYENAQAGYMIRTPRAADPGFPGRVSRVPPPSRLFEIFRT